MTIEEKIIDFWSKNKDNRISVIAKKFDVSEHKISKLIDKHLKDKKHYVK
jgi:hypothetical protein